MAKYINLRDRFDGGGAGQSGPEFQGGGLISDLGNMLFSPRGSRNAGPMAAIPPQAVQANQSTMGGGALPAPARGPSPAQTIEATRPQARTANQIPASAAPVTTASLKELRDLKASMTDAGILPNNTSGPTTRPFNNPRGQVISANKQALQDSLVYSGRGVTNPTPSTRQTPIDFQSPPILGNDATSSEFYNSLSDDVFNALNESGGFQDAYATWIQNGKTLYRR